MLLTGKVAMVTGSAFGIGRATVIACAKEGGNVACLDIEAVDNAGTASEVREIGTQALALDCDIGDATQVRRAVATVLDQFGRIDLLVNNAAVFVDTALTNGTFSSQTTAYRNAISSCALGAYYATLATVRDMIKRREGGNIINVITEHVKPGHYMTGSVGSGYDGAKWVQWRQTESWAIELEPFGIRVNAICPGATDTRMTRAVAPELVEDGKGMPPSLVAEGVLNIVRQGPAGPVGESYLIGASGSDTGFDDVAALLKYSENEEQRK